MNKDYIIIGKNVTIGSNCSIGNDGFQVEQGKIVTHYGRIIIEDDVDIHSNVCIDRALEPTQSTVIGKGTKIDNLVHVAHNVKIGQNVILVAGVILGGSCIIKDGAWLGLNVTIKPEIIIGKNAHIGMGAVVTKSIPDNCKYWYVGNPAKPLKPKLTKRILKKIIRTFKK